MTGPILLRGVGLAGADTSGLALFASPRALRRIDRYSRMALHAAFLAARDAGEEPLPQEETGVIVATGYGATRTTFAFLDTVIADGDALASPTCFSTSVHNAAAATISIVMGIRGPTLTVSQFALSVAAALLTASDWLAEGRAERILLVAVDEAGEVVEYCHRRAGRGAPWEGAAGFLLSRAEGAPPGRGVVLEVPWGASFPADRGAPQVAPDPSLADFPVSQAWALAMAARRVRSGEVERAVCLPSGGGGIPGIVVAGRG